MKSIKNIGKTLTKNEQKELNGGRHNPSNNYVCIDNFPFTYNVQPGQLCNDGSVPLCA